MKKVISADVHLKALALFTMANQNYLRAEACGESLAELLGYEDGWAGGFGDGWLQKGADFNECFKNEGFVVRRKKKAPPKRAKR